MEILQEILHNKILMSAVIGWAVAQVLKTIIHILVTKKFDPERLVGTGGMPSSHSATVCGLATAAYIVCGPASAEFAIAAILAIVVMYDALGVRRETGKQAVILNEMMEFFNDMGNSKISFEKKLKEFVGHSPLQVFAGALLGISIAIALCEYL